MKMSYRGNKHQPSETALLEVKEGDVLGKYRGVECHRKLPRHIPQLQPKIYLKYRGIAYSSNPNAQPYFIPHDAKAQPEENLSTQTIVSEETKSNLAIIHQANLRRNLERRMEVAQTNENYRLLAMLKKEADALDEKKGIKC
ncbi:DUF4278 domain-containing protein [Cyanobacterium stanieri LEGE 03274]|uniref:DUF4278 domain-containing protein n=1 Tax=Cyanobacterium stanieri LEGE 03274 TaxID=1828756 RepID=A0ABR9V2R7_9CHRO|nr:DUF4278 domain-containing protein [Cyanobacterium stanieri]MBE9222191.1 DUF4278 domain-containing protein [Cyanobacterium stanieri LEGE 03274]